MAASAPEAAISDLTEYALPISESQPSGIAIGPDGNLWFAERGTIRGPQGAIGRITLSGDITGFPLVAPLGPNVPFEVDPQNIVAGAEGELWFTGGEGVGRISITGRHSLVPTPHLFSSYSIAAGADGDLWFTTDEDSLGRVTPAGQVTKFRIKGPGTYDISAGPGSSLSFVSGQEVGRIAPDGSITYIPVSPRRWKISNLVDAGDLAASPDGTLWVTDVGRIHRIDKTGILTSFALPTPNALARGITVGPEGDVWFAVVEPNDASNFLEASGIGRINAAGQLSVFPVTPRSYPEDVIIASDGAAWFTAPGTNAIARLSSPEPAEPLTIYTARLLHTRAAPGHAATLVISLSAPASLEIGLEKEGAGVRRGNRCAVLRHGARPIAGKPCRTKNLVTTAYAPVLPPGKRQVRVRLRGNGAFGLSGEGAPLPAGAYTLRMIAHNVTGSSPPAHVALTIAAH